MQQAQAGIIHQNNFSKVILSYEKDPCADSLIKKDERCCKSRIRGVFCIFIGEEEIDSFLAIGRVYKKAATGDELRAALQNSVQEYTQFDFKGLILHRIGLLKENNTNGRSDQKIEQLNQILQSI